MNFVSGYNLSVGQPYLGMNIYTKKAGHRTPDTSLNGDANNYFTFGLFRSRLPPAPVYRYATKPGSPPA